MSLILPKTCSMGGSQTGLVGTIGVTLLNPDGTTHTARATAGIYEIGGGCYGNQITFDDNWKGSIKWDTGGGSPVYASEEYVIEGLVDAIEEDTGTTLDALIKDIPTVAEFEARSILAADYVIVGDTIAGVTAVTNDVGITQVGADKVRASVCVTGDPANSIGKALHELYTNRLTSTRAGYLDNINNANLATIADISTLTATEIAYLNASISSRSSHAASAIWSVGTRALTDKAGFGLSTAGILAIWHQLTANIVTASTIGKLLKDDINATISSRSSHNAAAIWSAGSRALSTPADYKADISALALENGGKIQNINEDTNEIQGKLPNDKIAGSSDAASLESKHGTGSWEGTTSADVADAVLDEKLDEHSDSGSLGEKLDGIRVRCPPHPWSKKQIARLFKSIDKIIEQPEAEPVNLIPVLQSVKELHALTQSESKSLKETTTKSLQNIARQITALPEKEKKVELPTSLLNLNNDVCETIKSLELEPPQQDLSEITNALEKLNQLLLFPFLKSLSTETLEKYLNSGEQEKDNG